MRAFSSCGKRGPLFIAVRGPLTIAASLAAEHRLQTRRLSSCGSRAQSLRRHVGSSQTRARTPVPCIGRQILNHCATREAPHHFFFRVEQTKSQRNSVNYPRSCLQTLEVWFQDPLLCHPIKFYTPVNLNVCRS